MITGWSFPSARVLAVGILIALGVTLLPGCDDSYPADLQYPSRTDLVVKDKPDREPQRLDRPGEFPQLFIAIEKGKNERPNDQELREDRKEQLQKLVLDPKDAEKVKPEQIEVLNGALQNWFGTPYRPYITAPEDHPIQATLKKLNDYFKLDDTTLAQGSVIYRDTCLHCHGLSGDGHGPTAPWVNPHPRDYRQGVFKFTSSSQDVGTRKPVKEDLARTIREGIEGTSMPNFRLLPDEHLDAVIAYVVHLSMRGQVEFMTLRAIAKGEIETGDSETGELAKNIVNGALDRYETVCNNWLDAQNNRIVPESTPPKLTDETRIKAIKHGFELFQGKGGAAGGGGVSCISCHIDFGRQSTYKFDEWGTIVRPANLLTGIYRGGRRPIDIYWRIHSGINGTGMPDSKGMPANDRWDLVQFVMALPYPKMLEQAGIKDQILP